jgi:hypothetical protein
MISLFNPITSKIMASEMKVTSPGLISALKKDGVIDSSKGERNKLYFILVAQRLYRTLSHIMSYKTA